jgi:hypothetical protein
MTPYPCIDLEELAAELEVDLQDAFKELEQLYAFVDERNRRNSEGLDLPCHRGCDMCCHESVFLTPLEFFYVWDFVQNNFSDESRAQIVSDGLRLYRKFEQEVEGLEKHPGKDDALMLAREIKFTCPFLGADGGCRVYDVRELYARLFGCTFNDAGGVYGCHLVGEHLGGKKVSLLSAPRISRRLDELPLTFKRQVYPYYIHLLYGEVVAENKALRV